MPMRRCLECPTLSPNTRCPAHEARRKSRRNADHKIAKAVVAAAKVCAICGEPARPISDRYPHGDPLTMGHKHTPFIAGGQATPDNVQPEHRSCNSKKRDRTT